MPYSLLELAQREIDLSRLARSANQQLERDHYPAGRIRSGGLKPLRLSASVVSLATTTTSEDDDCCTGLDVDESLSEYSDSISIYSTSSFAASLADIGDEARVYTNPLAIQTMTSVASGSSNSREEQPITDEEFERALDALCDDYDWTAVTIDDDDEEEEEEESDDDDDDDSILRPSMMKPLDVYLAPWTSLIEGSMVESESDEDEDDEDDGVYVDLIPIPSTHTKTKTMGETPTATTTFTPTPMSEPVTHEFEFAQRYLKPLSDAGLQVPSSDDLSGQDAGLPLLREIILEMVVKYEEGEEDHQRRWGLKVGWKGVKKWVGQKFDKLRDSERL